MLYIERECRDLSLKELSREQIKQLSMIELTYELLASNKQPIPFKDLVKELSSKINIGVNS